MIARLTGHVAAHEEKSLIIEVNGVGYRVYTLSVLRSQHQLGESLSLLIHHHVGDDQEVLFGFSDAESLRFFELLLTVPSIGPRTAMNVLEIAPPAILEQAVAEADTALLTKVSGVGKRTAERILVELREKIPGGGTAVPMGSIQHEAIEALVSIGYSPAQARQAVRNLPKEVTTVEEAVKAALRVKAS